MLDDATSLGQVSPLEEGAPLLLLGEPRLVSWSTRSSGCPRVDPRRVAINRRLLQTLPGPLLRLHRAMPIEVRDGTLLLGLENPDDFAVREAIRRLTGLQVAIVQLCPNGGELPAWEELVPTSLPTIQPGFQLLDSRLEARITGSLVWVRLSQNYLNPTQEALGGAYQVPLPQGALLQGVWAEQDGRLIQAETPHRVILAGELHLNAPVAPVTAQGRIQLSVQYVYKLERQADGFRVTLPYPLSSQGVQAELSLHWPGLKPDRLSCSRPANWFREQNDRLQIRIQPG